MDQAGRIMRKANIFNAGFEAGKNISRRFSKATAMPNWILKRTRYNIPHGDDLFLQDILEGKISGKRIEKLLNDSPKIRETASGGKIKTLENFVNKLRP
ncbi:MAG: hypothetical protein LBD11_07815 [Candidatus Peribacteria bacterium]|nr:hypothetical protein [Candidatus Peribacteria bacterium]